VVADLFTSALERMRSDLAMRASEERFRALAEHAKDPICEFSADGRFLYASPSFTELMGYPREELGRLRFADLVHPADYSSLIRNAWPRRRGAGTRSTGPVTEMGGYAEATA
jgi:PAS domain S-box-containing protein